MLCIIENAMVLRAQFLMSVSHECGWRLDFEFDT